MPGMPGLGGDRLVVDHDTAAYFDHCAPEYAARRLRRAVQLVNEHKTSNATLIDIGCGAGNVLAHLARRTGLTNLVGIDVSPRCLALAGERIDADLHLASILDPATVRRFGGQFDFAIMAAVLHHLIGPTRRHSRRAAQVAVANAFHLVRPGGYLVIVEPTFAPSAPLAALFWTKKVTSTFISRRLPIGTYWNNIGSPVVSYYSHRQVLDMVRLQPAAKVVYVESVPQPLSKVAEALVNKTNTTIMAMRVSITAREANRAPMA
jgi:2-polyprenyl-3-methyl-5-hydroxy-6-metoxy-1,4-benzoquinol methylase